MDELDMDGICILCSKNPGVIFNIGLRATPICGQCANIITFQNIGKIHKELMERKDG